MNELKVLITRQQIAQRTAEIGAAITRDFRDEPVIFVAVLKGAAIFMADLARQVQLDATFDFISVSSYGVRPSPDQELKQGWDSTGEVRLSKDLDHSIAGKNVILVEDILDTGLTLTFLKKLLVAREPKAFRIAALLDKPSRRKLDIRGDYIGFTIPDEFVVGYGLDYAEMYRNLPDVCVIPREQRREATVIIEIRMGSATQNDIGSKVEPLLLEVADVVNSTLDLDTTLRRVAELVRKVIDYKIFAILLLNEKSQELGIRFQIGYPKEVADRTRIKVGHGITGIAAQTREAVMVNDVSSDPRYIDKVPNICSELAVPLIVKNKVIGVINIDAEERDFFQEEHKRLLTLIASRMAVGIENARLHTRTTRQARTLQLLNEISRELTSILNVDELLKHIGELLSRLIDYQMFSILLVDSTRQKLQHHFSLRFQENIQLKHDIPIGNGIVGYAAQNKVAVLVPDVSKDTRYIQVNQETKSELAVPLIYKDNVIGVLDLEHTRRGFFTEDHKKTVTTLAAQIAIALENARLYEEIAKQELRLERDLALARELQFRLLPQSLPQLRNLEIAAKFSPARAIGGDLYDIMTYSLDRAALVVGDVSGKGAPAAIYAALVSGILRSHSPIEPSPAEMLSAVNFSLGERRIDGQFVSIIYAVWDDLHRTLQISNSGLPRPIYCHNGEIEVIEATGLPLGLFDDAEYDEFSFQANTGDLFIFFSDGILDATNASGELFGRRGVEAIVRENCKLSAQEIVDAIFNAVQDHSSGGEAFDDQTILAIRVKGHSGKRK